MHDLFASVAIAGAWGYIGRKLLDAARHCGLSARVLDPGPWPEDLPPGSVGFVPDAADFCSLPAGLFHLALHPEHRRCLEERLMARAAVEALWILNEKPMAAPDQPDGVDQGWDPRSDSYGAILDTLARWRCTVSRSALLTGLYPNPRLACRAFQLSGVLWCCSHEGRRLELPDGQAIDAFDSGYATARAGRARYPGAAHASARWRPARESRWRRNRGSQGAHAPPARLSAPSPKALRGAPHPVRLNLPLLIGP